MSSNARCLAFSTDIFISMLISSATKQLAKISLEPPCTAKYAEGSTPFIPKRKTDEFHDLRSFLLMTLNSFSPKSVEKIMGIGRGGIEMAYFVSQSISTNFSTFLNSGSPVRTTAFSRWAVATAKQSAKESVCRAFILDAEITALKSFSIPHNNMVQWPRRIKGRKSRHENRL